jgi:DNA-binding HxlR family transcriptional regulator
MPAEQPLGTIAVETTLAVLGGKWKLLILWYLQDGARRYGELKKLMPGITEKMLIQQLRELEHDGIVARTVYLEVPPKVEYSFTEYGKSLIPVFNVLCAWGEAYLQRKHESAGD